MPALFPRWTNSVARGSLFAAVVVALGVPATLMIWVRTSFASGEHASIVQPVPFDHRVHAHSLRIDCRYCHSTVELGADAGIPPTVACVSCHKTSLYESKTFAPVRASLASGRPIEWRRVNALPDFVFFDHSIHIAKGVGCATCHGRVDQMAQVEQATPMSMGWCLSCHRDPMPHLQPGAKQARSLTSCTTCHR
jgi:hypothetical protein